MYANLNVDNPLERAKFLKRLSTELSNKGIVELLRKGFRYLHHRIELYNATPNEQNKTAVEAYNQNIFSVIRQVRYSKEFPKLALDFAIFINGLPVITFELKNQLTKQCVDDAVKQYRTDRDPKELLFNFKRCAVHFAVDDVCVKMCTKLDGKDSWFLPFNKGTKEDGAGNDPNPDGLATDYLWKEALTKRSLSNIVENFAQVVESEDKKTGKKKYTQIFPRYHQLKVVRDLLQHTQQNSVGQKYLIQHSAGSGKSNSIAWLAHQLVVLEQENKPMLDSVIVVTDRVNLDKQIKNTIRQFMQESATVAWADSASILRDHINAGKKIIITTVHKFPHIMDGISENRQRKFAIIIDEAHSSQNGSMSAKMNQILSGTNIDDENFSLEDKINATIEGRKMLSNANYYAFTATPKNKTLQMFGVPYPKSDGEIGYRPFHNYTMKQAIEEGFIMDVLAHYTPITSFYQLAKRIDDDPQFDKKRSEKKLRYFVESNPHTIAQKATIIVEHFHSQVVSKGKVGGQARVMVVTSSIERAIDYYHEITKQLTDRRSPFKAIVAFSGDKEYRGGETVNESSINGFPSSKIEEYFEEDPYRILVVADKFQTGFDQPLLHTMYVDKALVDIKAVQTLSRLNRAHPKKNDTFVLDFANDTDTIQKSFQDYYKTTVLSSETDPNKLNDLIAALEKPQIYDEHDINTVVERLCKIIYPYLYIPCRNFAIWQ
ncbi:Type I restriction-modification system, subunit R [Mucinivorans hirudinis]|uniref:Type I restriction-modification system, subunit R n=1 Tax=Mucinivorans hirudinis TaxID=1433126 RepID=A0A060RBG0_9BACT|nr:Type I restriction-modification system, subunit R [Mucinivorans hirudinis]